MVNLRAIANLATRAINPNVTATALRSTGFERRDGGVRVPKYAQSRVIVQVQALTFSDLTQLDGVNIQGVRRAVYLTGIMAGLVRVAQEGGDLLIFDPGILPEGTTWLCAHVLEQWPDWVKIAITLQAEVAPPLNGGPSDDFSDETNSQNQPGTV